MSSAPVGWALLACTSGSAWGQKKKQAAPKRPTTAMVQIPIMYFRQRAMAALFLLNFGVPLALWMRPPLHSVMPGEPLVLRTHVRPALKLREDAISRLVDCTILHP